MSDSQPPRCRFCQQVIEIKPLASVSARLAGAFADSSDSVPNGRNMQSGPYAYLHHPCLSPQANTDSEWWVAGESWWACKDLDRELDAQCHFDLHCQACAERWEAEGRPTEFD